jgi:hypothetical protein
MKTSLLRITRSAFLVCGVVLSAGCLKINTTVAIKADGSGTWQLVYAMPTHMIRQVQMARELAVDLEKAGSVAVTNPVARPLDIPMIFDEPTIRARFVSLARDGLTLTKLQTYSRSGWQYVEMTVKFSRFENLVKQHFFDSCGISLKQAGDDALKMVVSLPQAGEGEERPNLADPAVNAALTPFLKGLVVAVTLEVPGTIRNSNSMASDVRRASWEWDFEKDAKAVDRLFKDKMILIFDSVGSRNKDFEKPAVR